MIFETVVTTVDNNGETHIAPMGVRRKEGLYVIAPFSPSTTLENLESVAEAVINLTDDVRVFAGCLSGRRDWPLCDAEQLKVKRLTYCLAHTEVHVERKSGDAQRPEFFCREILTRQHAPFQGFNRAQAAVLEAAILVSRLDRLPMEKIASEIDYLKIAMEKTAGEREQTAWQWLMEEIQRYRRRNSRDGAT